MLVPNPLGLVEVDIGLVELGLGRVELGSGLSGYHRLEHRQSHLFFVRFDRPLHASIDAIHNSAPGIIARVLPAPRLTTVVLPALALVPCLWPVPILLLALVPILVPILALVSSFAIFGSTHLCCWNEL